MRRALSRLARRLRLMFRRKSDPRDEMIAWLMQQNADLMDRLQETIGQIHIHQATAAQTKLNAELSQAPGFRWDVSEDEEDATELARREDGSIDELRLADLLAQAQFENTEIEFH